VYYLSKYYELLDTFFVVVKKARVPHFGLQAWLCQSKYHCAQIYHHAVVLIMAWLWLEEVQSLQFGGLIFNTSVHVIMYYYYFRVVLKLPVPWKRYITKIQA